ncbi:MAG: glycerol-3-phosphate acyltransferase PlsX [Crocinitomicaceae bacterium]|jgi:glycerol-3-phosphate acyltransferase PlsX
MVTIAVDAMGGDFGPRVTVPAVVSSLKKYPDLNIQLFGNRAKLAPYLQDAVANSRLTIVHTDVVVTSGERISSALRKRMSSMRMAIDLVREDKAQAMVSAGNTGALVAISRYVLKTMLGIDRPALIGRIPNEHGYSYMLDLGANVECDSENLHQFAVMGSAFCSALSKKKSPRVALLNIGSEEVKGNEEIRLTNANLKHSDAINYIGYVEGDDIYKGLADVIVTNGFSGNIALKTSEGLVRYASVVIRDAFKHSLYSRVIGLFALPLLERLYRSFEPHLKNGGVLLGVQGVVVKSHGKALEDAFGVAISNAYVLSKNNLLQQISDRLDNEII